MKNKYLYKLGCVVLAGSMLLSMPAVATAAQQEPYTEVLPPESESETDSLKDLPELETSETDPTETPDIPVETEKQTDAVSRTDEIPDIGLAPGEESEKNAGGNASVPLQLPGTEQDGSENQEQKRGSTTVKEIADEGSTIQKPDGEETQTDHSDAAAGYTSNIIAGNDIYLGELSDEYGLTFAERFETIMDGIEEDYRAFLEYPEEFVAENWQDVLAVYVLRHGMDEGGITLNAKCRDELEKIFFLMNIRSNSAMLRRLEAEQSGEADAAAEAAIETARAEAQSAEEKAEEDVQPAEEKTEEDAQAAESTEEQTAEESPAADDSGAVRTNRRAAGSKASDGEKEDSELAKEDSETEKEDSETEKETYALTVEDYITLYGAEDEEKELLEKYTSTECRQLCAIVTAAKGFVRGEAGEGVSEERIAIVSAACSLIGKVGYFWGGKSYAMGWDDRWGDPMTVSASGSRSSGTVRSYGLDCSGFVAWSYYNGLNGKDAGIGNHTTTQWDATEMVDSRKAKPGDLVFYRPGSAGDDNHVGIVIGVNDNGSLLVAHCSSSQNGVVTGEAWSAGFQYVRSPIGLDDETSG